MYAVMVAGTRLELLHHILERRPARRVGVPAALHERGVVRKCGSGAAWKLRIVRDVRPRVLAHRVVHDLRSEEQVSGGQDRTGE
eukprot:356940-Chlamydomonas_euryale.AAC.9